MSYWEVRIDTTEPFPFEHALRFVPIESILKDEDRFGLDDRFFLDVMTVSQSNYHYNVLRNMNEMLSPTGEDFSTRKLYAFIGVHTGTGNNLTLGYLFAQYPDNSWEILGLWPDTFAGAVKDDIGVLMVFLAAFKDKPEDWERVYVFQPSGVDSDIQ